MKLKVIDENNFVLFIINKDKIPPLEEEALATYLKAVFCDIKSKYKFDVSGIYDVFIYIDAYYGMIIEALKKEEEYFSYYDKQIEMKIVISNEPFLYQVSDILNISKKILAKSSVYFYNNEIYLLLNAELNFLEMGSLLENSTLIYEDTKEILKNGEKMVI